MKIASVSRTMNVIIVDDNTAVVSKKFMKNASIFGSPEFFKWREVKAMYPKAKMYTKSIKKNPDKETNRNMTYKNMAEYISTLDNAEKLLAELELVVKRSKVQANPYRSVWAWFEQKFSDYDSYKEFFSKQGKEKKEKNNIYHLNRYRDDYVIDNDEADNTAKKAENM